MNSELIKRIDNTIDNGLGILHPIVIKLLNDCKMALGSNVQPIYRSHIWWGAGETDCPRDIKGSNGELYELRCKRCGTNDSHEPCRPRNSPKPYQPEEPKNYDNVRLFKWYVSNPSTGMQGTYTSYMTEHEIRYLLLPDCIIHRCEEYVSP